MIKFLIDSIKLQHQYLFTRLSKNKLSWINPYFWWTYITVAKQQYFHCVRKQFVLHNNLDDNFDFPKYLRRGRKYLINF